MNTIREYEHQEGHHGRHQGQLDGGVNQFFSLEHRIASFLWGIQM